VKRVHHPYHLWEENKNGMWRLVHGEKREPYIKAAAELMRNPAEFKEAMRRAIKEWPVSCEHNLSHEAMNRLAWLGHAGCCIATGSPEELTRLGWHRLNESQQGEANRVAAETIKEWESEARDNGCQSDQLGLTF
jgi:hypothetical protein